MASLNLFYFISRENSNKHATNLEPCVKTGEKSSFKFAQHKSREGGRMVGRREEFSWQEFKKRVLNEKKGVSEKG